MDNYKALMFICNNNLLYLKMIVQTRKKNIFIRTIVTLFAVVALAITPVLSVRAQEYNCGAYGAGEYGQGVCAAATEEEDDSLSDTGQKLSVLVPALLILGGTVLLFRSRKKMKARQAGQSQE